jgi:DNA (cytosine-5)-methyltransferase 1
MKLLDLYCKAGGAAMGYHRAGFDVVGVDIEPQKNYPFKFVQADAIEFLIDVGSEFDAIHASPPCQAYSKTQKLQGRRHPELIEPTRKALEMVGRPWIIENVPESPLRDPVLFCGASFGLRTYRHRLFETSFGIVAPQHFPHMKPTAKMGRRPKIGEMIHVVGNFSGVSIAREAMGIDWMTRNEMSEAIPPVYTEWIGRQLLSQIEA